MIRKLMDYILPAKNVDQNSLTEGLIEHMVYLFVWLPAKLQCTMRYVPERPHIQFQLKNKINVLRGESWLIWQRCRLHFERIPVDRKNIHIIASTKQNYCLSSSKMTSMATLHFHFERFPVQISTEKNLRESFYDSPQSLQRAISSH
jgi:hypothetical protein